MKTHARVTAVRPEGGGYRIEFTIDGGAKSVMDKQKSELLFMAKRPPFKEHETVSVEIKKISDAPDPESRPEAAHPEPEPAPVTGGDDGDGGGGG